MIFVRYKLAGESTSIENHVIGAQKLESWRKTQTASVVIRSNLEWSWDLVFVIEMTRTTTMIIYFMLFVEYIWSMVLHAVESISVKLNMRRANGQQEKLLIRFSFLKNGNNNQFNWFVFWTFCENRNRFDWTRNTESITFTKCSTFIVTWILCETKMKTILYFAYFHIILSSTFENLSILFVFFCVLILPFFLNPCCDVLSSIQLLDVIAFRYIANRSVKHRWPIHSVHKDIVNIIRMTNCHEFTANLFASMALSVCSRFFKNL